MSQAKRYKVIDLFSGAGGFGLGFKMANYDLFLSLEIDQWASDTLRENNKDGMIILQEDIRRFKPKDILQVCRFKPDIILGGPPCQGFSTAGSVRMDPSDPRNSLFKYFARWVKCLEPSIFIMENVRGILSRCNAKNEKTIEVIKRTFSRIGYHNINIWTLNAAEYGVPQLRKRVFIIGHKKNINIDPPSKTHYVDVKVRGLEKAITVKKAISDLPRINASEGAEIQYYTRKPITEYQVWARGKQKILYNHMAMKHTKRIIERFSRIGIGESVSNVSIEYKERKRNGNGAISVESYSMNNRRFDPGKPAYTIPASFYSSFIHPYQHRNITAREAARLQSFPDYYRFAGKRTIISYKLLKKMKLSNYSHLSQYNQIGNAVPPLIAKAIAEHVYNYL